MWSQLSTADDHVSYACLAFGLIIVMSVALILKHRFDFSEVIVATVFGLVVGPHCLNWFSPSQWTSNEHKLTLELSRIVMDIQIFAASAELPPKYVLKCWWSLLMLLVPVMVCGFLLNSIFVYGLVPQFRWVESLVVAGCVTATDPVLASAVLSGPGFAKTLPPRLIHLLTAESASNDGMALPFVMLPVYILLHEHRYGEIAKDFIVLTVLYQVLFALVLGAVIGGVMLCIFMITSKYYVFRHEYMLIYNIIVALFCCGVGSLLGCDDFLVSFAAGAAFSWTGWKHEIINVEITGFIDLLLNTSYFVYFGAVVPWQEFNKPDLRVWRFIVIVILILVGRRIPTLAVLYKLIPEIHGWKEMLISGHFGPIGVAAIYMSLETEELLAKLKGVDFLEQKLWPIVAFVVLSSIIVHGVSVIVMRGVEHAMKIPRRKKRQAYGESQLPSSSSMHKQE